MFEGVDVGADGPQVPARGEHGVESFVEPLLAFGGPGPEPGRVRFCGLGQFEPVVEVEHERFLPWITVLGSGQR